MLKAVDKTMVIGDVRLMLKSGGRSGIYTRREGGKAEAGGQGRKAGMNVLIAVIQPCPAW
jgi:hypothetical protein